MGLGGIRYNKVRCLTSESKLPSRYLRNNCPLVTLAAARTKAWHSKAIWPSTLVGKGAEERS